MPAILKRHLRVGSRSASQVATAVSKAGTPTEKNKVAALRVLLAMPRTKFARLLGRTDIHAAF
jgi:hypothetical protein